MSRDSTGHKICDSLLFCFLFKISFYFHSPVDEKEKEDRRNMIYIEVVILVVVVKGY
jgi:hypothetical protein